MAPFSRGAPEKGGSAMHVSTTRALTTRALTTAAVTIALILDPSVILLVLAAWLIAAALVWIR